ncbi:MAG: OmpH family outer membrane protein [Planctomycetota bacterium]
MRTARRIQVLGAFFLGMYLFTSQLVLVGQNPEFGRQESHRFGLVDVDFIMRSLPEVREFIRNEAAIQQTKHAVIQRKRAQRTHAMNTLKQMDVGSREYALQEQRVSLLDAELRLPRIERGPNKEWTELRERAYLRIAEAVRMIAKQKKIVLVINHKVNPRRRSPAGRLSDSAEFVFHFDDTVNLNDAVLQQLKIADRNLRHDESTCLPVTRAKNEKTPSTQSP